MDPENGKSWESDGDVWHCARAGPYLGWYLLNLLCVSICQVVEDVLVSWGSEDSMCPWTSHLTRCFVTCTTQSGFLSLCSLTDGWNRPAGSGKAEIRLCVAHLGEEQANE